MAVPYTFAGATSAIPLSQLDTNFATTFTLGNTAIQLGNTVTTLNNMTLANVTISSGNVTITNVSVTTANVTTGNITTLTSTNATITNMSSGNVTITGGTINGTTLGATTASSANVTTLTTSSTVTLNGGTANGVAYLNGSKVLTTGSALSFDGTRLTSIAGKFGVGTASNSATLMVNNLNGSATGIQLFQDGVESWIMGMPASSAALTWANSGVEQMRLTSTGLGIGTNNPSKPLHILSAINTDLLLSSSNASTSVGGRIFFGNTTLSDTSTYISGAPGRGIDLYTNSLLRASIDSSGNLGIGTSSPRSKADVNGVLTVGDSSDPRVNLYRNVSLASSSGAGRIDFGGRYDASNYATGAVIGSLTAGTWSASNYGCSLLFYTTAQNSTSFTERMRLDSSGNLGLGVTPSAWSAYTALQIKNTAILGFGPRESHYVHNAYWDGTSWKYIGTGEALRYDQFYGGHIWYTAPSGTAGSAISFTQAMTLDASGNLGIGTSSPLGKMTVRGLSGYNLTIGAVGTDARIDATNDNGSGSVDFVLSGSSLKFNTSGSERARIDSSGALLVGCTSNNYLVADSGIQLQPNGTARFGTDGTSTLNIISFVNGTNGTPAEVGKIQTSGSSTSYLTSSDYRLKNTIAPMTGALAKVAALKPVTYKWNVNGSDGEGFIAHELAEVVPQCVSGTKDAVDADGNPVYQGIDTSFLVATLTAAIQELKAEFDAYKASHP